MTENEPPNAIGQRLRRARLAAGYATQKALAEELNLSKTTYNAHEKRPGGIPNSWVIRYSKLLECDLVWLLTGEGDMRTGSDSERTLRLPEAVPPAAQQAVQVLLDHVKGGVTPVVSAQEAEILQEAVELFARIHGDQRVEDCNRARGAIAKIYAPHENKAP